MRENLCKKCIHRGHIKDAGGHETYWCKTEAENRIWPLHGAIVECSEFVSVDIVEETKKEIADFLNKESNK